MSKITLNTIGSLQDTTTAQTTLNTNNAIIQTAFDNTVSRDGTAPNSMNANFDMNSFHILNLPAPASSNEPMRLADATLLNGSGTITALPAGGATGQLLTKNSSASYDASWRAPAASIPNPSVFGGRLTPLSATPIVNTDVSGSQNLYYAPYTGSLVPTYTSGVWTTNTFTSSSSDQVGLTLPLAGSASWAAGTMHDVFAVMDAGTLKLGTRLWDAGMSSTSTQIANVTTVTTGTTGTAWTQATGAFNGNPGQSGTNSASLSPSNVGMNNFLGQSWGTPRTLTKIVVTAPSDHFIMSNAGVMDAKSYGSNDGVNWNLLSVHWFNDANLGATYTFTINTDQQIPYSYHRIGFDGNGTGNLWIGQVQFYTTTPAVSRRLTYRDGILVNDASMTVRTSASTTITTAQYEGVYLGSIRIDAGNNGQLSCHTSWGASRTWGVWNMYNRTRIVLKAGIRSTATSYVVTNTTFASCNSTSTFSTDAFLGMPHEPVRSKLLREVVINAQTGAIGYEGGIGVDTTSDLSGYDASVNLDTLGQFLGQSIQANLTLPPYSGLHTLYAIERINTGTGQLTTFNDPRETVLQTEYMG